MADDENAVAAPADTAPTEAFTTLVERVVAKCQAFRLAGLKVFHYFGTTYNSLEKNEGKKYGDADSWKLSEALLEAGAAPPGVNTDRPDSERDQVVFNIRDHLYKAGKFAANHSQKDLDEMVASGYTPSHVIELDRLSEEMRAKVAPLLLTDGKVPSIRGMRQLIEQVAADSAATAASSAAAEAADRRENPQPAAELDPTAPTTEAGEAETAAAAPANNEAAPETGRPTNPTAEIANPVKEVRTTTKLLVRTMDQTPNAFAAIRSYQQNGYDSEAANNRMKEQLRTLKATAHQLLEPLQELERTLEAELAAAEVTNAATE
jgi:hypothetical protein